MKHDFSQSRRSMLRKSALSVAGLLLAGVFPERQSRAQDDAQRVFEDDAQARQLEYVHDASESEVRTDSNAFCHNCRFFKGDQSTEWAPCDVFAGKLVNAQGWCNVWAAR